MCRTREVFGQSDAREELHLVGLGDTSVCSQSSHELWQTLLHLVHTVQQDRVSHCAHLGCRSLG